MSTSSSLRTSSTSRPMPSLPPEIIATILQQADMVSVDPVSDADEATTSDTQTMAAACLVSRTFLPFARRLLYATIRLKVVIGKWGVGPIRHGTNPESYSLSNDTLALLKAATSAYRAGLRKPNGGRPSSTTSTPSASFPTFLPFPFPPSYFFTVATLRSTPPSPGSTSSPSRPLRRCHPPTTYWLSSMGAEHESILATEILQMTEARQEAGKASVEEVEAAKAAPALQVAGDSDKLCAELEGAVERRGMKFLGEPQFERGRREVKE